MQSVTPPYQCLLSGLCQRSRVTCLLCMGGTVYKGHFTSLLDKYALVFYYH